MIDTIIKELKEASEKLDKQITLAHAGLRNFECGNCKSARMLIQEAITKLLEVS